MNTKLIYAQELHKVLHENLELEKIITLIETPKHDSHGDLAFPCFELSKAFRKAPMAISAEVADKITSPFFAKVEAMGPYVNVFLSREQISKEIIKEVNKEGIAYGSLDFGNGKNVVIDFSSPNIAKPFSMGHLRSTVIGNAIKKISQKCGYNVIGVNHVGDWGTQFGKLIYAYKTWGTEEDVKANPIKELFKLYVKFHDEAANNPSLEDEGRAWFKRLENGDQEAYELWTWFRDVSLKDFSRIYDLLGVEFDSFNGEAFYNNKMDKMIALLEEKNLLTESEGAMVVNLDENGMPPCLIKKSDGATLYATRDLTAALYRQETYHFERAVYVVGGEQALHFQQLFHVLRKMGMDFVDGMSHVPFGLMLKDGKKMSTRKGKIVLLEEVINDAISLAQDNINDKNPDLTNKQEIARQVGIGAVIFHDLKNERTNNVEFSLEQMLKFEGETGPYIQYTHARACSILRKGVDIELDEIKGFEDDYSWQIVKELQLFPNVIEKAFEKYEPSVVAKYLIDLAQSFNKYYGNTRVLEEDNLLVSRLALVKAVVNVLNEGLRILGISAPEEM
jgi:arginyl-tRNA synthetase